MCIFVYIYEMCISMGFVLLTSIFLFPSKNNFLWKHMPPPLSLFGGFSGANPTAGLKTEHMTLQSKATGTFHSLGQQLVQRWYDWWPVSSRWGFPELLRELYRYSGWSAHLPPCWTRRAKNEPGQEENMPRDEETASFRITERMDSNMLKAILTSKLFSWMNQQILFLREAILTWIFNQKGPAMDRRQSRVDRNYGQSKASLSQHGRKVARKIPNFMAFGKTVWASQWLEWNRFSSSLEAGS